MSKNNQNAKTKTASEDIKGRQDDLGKTLNDLEAALKKSRKKVGRAAKRKKN